MKQIGRLFQYRKMLVAVTLLCTAGAVLATLLWNRELARIIDTVQQEKVFPVENIWKCIIYLLLGAVMQGGMSFGGACAGEYATHDMRMQYAEIMLKCPYEKVASENVGEYISGLQNEMEDINRYVSEQLFNMISMVISFVFTLIYLMYQNRQLTLLYLLPVVFLTVYTTVSSKVIYGYTVAEQKEMEKINAVLGTILQLVPVIRVYEAEKLLRDQYTGHIGAWQEASVKQERVKARLMSLAGVLSCVPLALLLGIGGSMVLRGELSMGTLYIFVNLSGNVSGVMINCSAHMAGFRRFCGNLNRVWTVMAGKEV